MNQQAVDNRAVSGADAKGDVLRKQLEQGEITRLGYAKGTLAIVEEYFPNSYNTHALFRDGVAMAAALERGDITRLQFDMMTTERKLQYDEKQAQLIEREVEQRTQNQTQKPASNPFAAAMLINMFNNSIQRNMPQQSTHCSSYALAGSVQTDCY